MNTIKLIRLLTETAAQKFPDDPTNAGLVISTLRNGGFYVSIVRYSSAYGRDKTTVCAGRGRTLRAAALDAAKKIAPRYTPGDRLTEYLDDTFLKNDTSLEDTFLECDPTNY